MSIAASQRAAFLRVPTYAVWAGAAAPVLFAVTVMAAGAARPGYSHIAASVGALTESGAANGEWINPLLAVSDLLAIFFGAGVFAAAALARRPLVQVAGGLIAANGILGLVAWAFPMDPVGAASTVGGDIHTVLAALMSLTGIAAMMAFGLWSRHAPNWERFGQWTLVAATLAIVTTALAGAAFSSGWDTAGLWERFAIGSYLAWLLLLAVRLARR